MQDTVRLQHVEKWFAGNHALADAWFSARSGELHALLGENGAGKSTLMNVLAGFYHADGGNVEIDGEAVAFDSPAAARAAGIGMVHQHFKLVPPFTVAENVLLANPPGIPWGRALAGVRKQIASLGKALGLDVDPDARVDSISVAERQRVEIIKALTGGARILILDEPTAVLTDEESDRLLATMRACSRNGLAIILITHKLREVRKYADRVTIMRGGRTVATEDPKGMSAAALTRQMLGSAPRDETPPATHTGEIRLKLLGLKATRDDGAAALRGLDLAVHGGHIYGIAGVGGNGQTELAEVLMGVREPDAGEIWLGSDDATGLRPPELRRRGLICIPADRYAYGLAGDLSISENYAIGGLADGMYGGPLWLDRKAMRREAGAAIERFEIHGAGPGLRARLLSGGNAQKLLLAREFSKQLSVLVAHSPTRGLDIRACAAVHELLRQVRESGAAVVLISEDLDEIMNLSDRIGVLNRGRIAGEFDRPADRGEIGHLMTGHA